MIIRSNESLSKTISYALRHAPQRFHLKLDENGWVDLNASIAALNANPAYQPVGEQDIVEMLASSEKKRFEIGNGRIRAFYGHSIPEKIIMEPSRPPKMLYHGTTRSVVAKIFAEGLKPRGRQYVHLSQDTETALQVGLRRDDQPVLFVVRAEEAFENGVKFYHGNEKIWLADPIPPVHLEIVQPEKNGE